jgi:hypothetical protein
VPAQALLDQLEESTSGAKSASLATLLTALDALPLHYRSFYTRKFLAALKRKLTL